MNLLNAVRHNAVFNNKKIGCFKNYGQDRDERKKVA